MIEIVLKSVILTMRSVYIMRNETQVLLGWRLYIRSVMFMSVTYMDLVIVIPIVNKFSHLLFNTSYWLVDQSRIWIEMANFRNVFHISIWNENPMIISRTCVPSNIYVESFIFNAYFMCRSTIYFCYSSVSLFYEMFLLLNSLWRIIWNLMI